MIDMKKLEDKVYKDFAIDPINIVAMAKLFEAIPTIDHDLRLSWIIDGFLPIDDVIGYAPKYAPDLIIIYPHLKNNIQFGITDFQTIMAKHNIDTYTMTVKEVLQALENYIKETLSATECIWKDCAPDINWRLFESSCGEQTDCQRIDITKFKVCPYCTKPIKIIK